jgi:hypothetical protein
MGRETAPSSSRGTEMKPGETLVTIPNLYPGRIGLLDVISGCRSYVVWEGGKTGWYATQDLVEAPRELAGAVH